MASRKESVGMRLLQSLKFWLVVLVLCAVAGTVAYYVGRDYVGKHLHAMEVEKRAPDVTPQAGTVTVASMDEVSSSPPVEAVVTVTEREVTAREERRVREELAGAEDGASLHQAEADAEEAAEEPEQQDAQAATDRFVVTAGAFADEENAEKQIQTLAEMGYEPYITTVRKEGITYRRVNVGAFSSRNEAEKVKERLTSEGFEGAIWTEQGS